jgi:hypothetical protein
MVSSIYSLHKASVSFFLSDTCTTTLSKGYINPLSQAEALATLSLVRQGP